jgi:hypothetical protein
MLFSVGVLDNPSGKVTQDFEWRECSTALRNRQRKDHKKGGIASAEGKSAHFCSMWQALLFNFFY